MGRSCSLVVGERQGRGRWPCMWSSARPRVRDLLGRRDPRPDGGVGKGRRQQNSRSGGEVPASSDGVVVTRVEGHHREPEI
jgi:hypothetical protein